MFIVGLSYDLTEIEFHLFAVSLRARIFYRLDANQKGDKFLDDALPAL